MADLSQMSDDDLKKAYLASLSDDELKSMHEQSGGGLSDKLMSGAQTTGKVLDYAPGFGRTATQKLADKLTNGDAAGTFTDAYHANAQPWEKYLEKRGVGEQNVQPVLGGLLRNALGLMGKDETKAREVAGPVLDTLSDPTVLAGPLGEIGRGVSSGAEAVGKGAAPAIKALSKLASGAGSAVENSIAPLLSHLNPISAVASIPSKVNGGIRWMGEAMSHMNPAQADAYINQQPAVMKMVSQLKDERQLPDLQKQGAQTLQAAMEKIKNSGVNASKLLDELSQGHYADLDTSKLESLAQHDPSIASKVEALKAKSQAYDAPKANYQDSTSVQEAFPFAKSSKAPGGEFDPQEVAGIFKENPTTTRVHLPDLRDLRQTADDIEKFYVTKSPEQSSISRNKEIAPLTAYLRDAYGKSAEKSGVPALQLLSEMHNGMDLQDIGHRFLGSPLNPFNTESADQVANLVNIERTSGGNDILDFRNKYKAAKSIVGDRAKQGHAGIQHGLLQELTRKSGRGLLNTSGNVTAPLAELSESAQSLVPEAIKSTPQEAYAKLLEAIQQANK